MVFFYFNSTHGNSKASCWKYVGFIYQNDSCREPIDNKRYYCIPCLEDQKKAGSCHLSKVGNFSVGTSTGNINHHLLDKHEIVVESSQAAVPLILKYISKHKMKSGEGEGSDGAACNITQHEFNRDILIWFVQDLLAFENVAKLGFAGFMHKVLPVFDLPSPKTLAGTALNDVYLAVLTKVKQELSTVRSVCVMSDGWTDRYHGRSYVGIRVSFVKEWTFRLVTLSCQVLTGSHSAKALADHTRLELSKFFPDLKKVLIATCHDGAANMMKASELLKSQSVQHCVAHALHLLITVDSIQHVDELNELIQKCRDIVTKLHFKSFLLEEEETSKADLEKLEDFRAKIKASQDIIELDDQFPVNLFDGSTGPEGVVDSAVITGDHGHRHSTLKGSCPTRWNSTLAMIESLTDLNKSVNNSLKKVGEAELCLSSDELVMLNSLTKILKEFEKFTELISCSSVPVLSIVPLMKLRIKRVCQPADNDEDVIGLFKHHILQNVDRRLKENDFMKISQVLDPMTKEIFSQDDAITLLQKAFTVASHRGILEITVENNSSHSQSTTSTADDTTTSDETTTEVSAVRHFNNLIWFK